MPAPVAAAGATKLLAPILGRAGVGKALGGGKAMGAMQGLSGMSGAVADTAQEMGFEGGAQQEGGGFSEHPAKN